MAVVTKYGTGARDPSSLKAQEGISAAAEIRVLASLIAIANGDSANSKYILGSIPTNAKINPGGTIDCDAITGVIGAKLGLAYPNGGAMILDNCIFSGQTLAAAATVTMRAATGSGVATPANIDKFVWQLAGLASDPGGNLDVVLTLNAAATAAGSVFTEMTYKKVA